MSTKNTNSLAAVYILEILNKYSDETHPLTQREIGEILADKYDFTLERKAIGRNLNSLASNGMGVIIVPHRGAYTKKNVFLSDEETRIICDMLSDSPYLTSRHVSRLTSKLVDSASDRLVMSKNPERKRRSRAPELADYNYSGVATVDIVSTFNEACSQCRQVYLRFLDGAAYCSALGTPCDLVFDKGKYYLKLYDEHTHEMRWIRVENIRKITITNRPATHRVNMKTDDVQLSRFVAPGEAPVIITLNVSLSKAVQVRELFEGCIFSELETGDSVTMLVKASASRVADYTKKHLGLFAVQQPEALRNEIKEYVEEAYFKYAS